MGARKFVLPKIRHLVPFRIPLGDISRPERSRPAEGYPTAHGAEQARIVHDTLTTRNHAGYLPGRFPSMTRIAEGLRRIAGVLLKPSTTGKSRHSHLHRW